jgi:hypothetical protein
MINTDYKIFDKYIAQLIVNFQSLNNRQGSGAFDNFLSASQYIPAYQWFINNVPKGSRVLDRGCGTGHFTDFRLNTGMRSFHTALIFQIF